jgi:opacity protein-like surface antigen
MKKKLILFISVLAFFSLDAQEKIERKSIVRLYAQTGFQFLQNEQLRLNYNTNATFFWGLGLQFGKPENAAVIPFVHYSSSVYNLQKKLPGNQLSDSSLSMKQVNFGLHFPFIKRDEFLLKASVGYSYGIIKESFYEINSPANGLLIGLGMERTVFVNSRISFDLSYQYQKTKTVDFRDFDVVKLGIGFFF